ncbi:MAG: fumarylacetoacetate hydrolase family protein [Candidatus Hydrogenedentota bacterium]|nr:MAG: fumarylacetoacetate hydrolase family protein [Candidatus Hydrogenedentota bacterium]
MKICRYIYRDNVEYGILEGEEIVALKGEPFSGIERTDKRRALAEVNLLSPALPSKVVAVGLNYQEHIDETGMEKPAAPILFIKPSTSVIGPGEPIVYPSKAARVDYEAELAVVIGKKCKDASPEEVRSAILGYTCLNDVTERFMQGMDGQWTRAKSFDTFCPIGPYIVTDIDPKGLKVEAYLNGEQKQSASTDLLIFTVEELVSFVSGVMTLLPGDVVATGTPSGVGPINPGDTIEIRIEKIGSLVNTVEKEAD